MKKLLDIVALTLAANFLALAGAVAWLYRAGHLDKERVVAIKQLLFPPPQAEAPTTQPAEPEGPPPTSKRLEDLLAKHAGTRSAADQIALVQQTFDATSAQLDRRERDVAYREDQVARANAKLADDRKALEGERKTLADQERQADRLASDKGFQSTLSLYNTMPSRQVKQAFMGLEEQQAAEYLDAMQPRQAARILKEFKQPDEVERMKRVLDKMRHPPALAANPASGAGPTAAATEGKE